MQVLTLSSARVQNTVILQYSGHYSINLLAKSRLPARCRTEPTAMIICHTLPMVGNCQVHGSHRLPYFEDTESWNGPSGGAAAYF